MFKLIYQVTDKIKDKISKLNEKGQGMVEYAVVLAAVALIAAAVFYSTGEDKNTLEKAVSNAYSNASSQITAAQSKPQQQAEQ